MMTAAAQNVEAIVIPSAHRTMLGAPPENKLRVFALQARDLMGHVRAGRAEHGRIVDALPGDG
jgi:hypothetical protein